MGVFGSVHLPFVQIYATNAWDKPLLIQDRGNKSLIDYELTDCISEILGSVMSMQQH